MPTSIAHPTWVYVGLAMVAVGIVLIRWANRNSGAGAVSSAEAETAFRALFRRRRLKTAAQPGKPKIAAPSSVRRSLSQLAGITGFILVMAGLASAVFGIFYV